MHSRPVPSMQRSCTLVPSAGKLIDEEGMVKLSWETGCSPLGKVVDVITYCSRSRWRAAKGDKRMVLVHTHGLFIT
jgi:hypothetical protein